MRKTIEKAEAKLAVMMAAMLVAAPAHAAGLQKATTIVNSITGDVKTFIPLLAVLILVCLGIAWGAKWIRFVTLLQFGAGVVLAGCAAELVSMLFS